MARSRMRLSRAGWWPERVSGSLDEETKRTARDWRTDRENEGLNPFRAMLDALQTRFRLRRPAWHPYPFWDLAADMRVPGRSGRPVARRMRNEEATLLRQRHLRGVLFSTTVVPGAAGGALLRCVLRPSAQGPLGPGCAAPGPAHTSRAPAVVTLLKVHPTGRRSKKRPKVEGHVVCLRARHAKLRREGYRKGASR